jgi:hypothetical protein
MAIHVVQKTVDELAAPPVVVPSDEWGLAAIEVAPAGSYPAFVFADGPHNTGRRQEKAGLCWLPCVPVIQASGSATVAGRRYRGATRRSTALTVNQLAHLIVDSHAWLACGHIEAWLGKFVAWHETWRVDRHTPPTPARRLPSSRHSPCSPCCLPSPSHQAPRAPFPAVPLPARERQAALGGATGPCGGPANGRGRRGAVGANGLVRVNQIKVNSWRQLWCLRGLLVALPDDSLGLICKG